MRIQNPQLQRTTGKNQRWFIRPYIPHLLADGTIRAQKERIYLGVVSEMGKREAVVAKNRELDKINRRQFVIQSQVNFGEFLSHYEKEFVLKPGNIAFSTQGKYLSHIKNHIRPAFGELMIAEVRTQLIDSWLAQKAKSGMAYATRQDLRNLMCAIFTQARKWGVWKEQNPAMDANAGRPRPAREKRKLTDDQTRLLLAALPFDVRLIVLVALSCALRISEVLGLQWKHIDWERRVAMIRQRWYRGDLDVPKNPRSNRDVKLGALIGELKRLQAGHTEEEFVFSVRTKWGGGRICRDDRSINQHFLRKAAKSLGFYWEGFGFHSFRREAITGLSQEMGTGQTMKVAGHSKPATTIEYTLADEDAQEKAVLTFQARFMGKTELVQ